MVFASIFPPLLLLIGCSVYIFRSQIKVMGDRDRTRIDYLRERQEVIYENLRDLNFEYRSGKYQADDYQEQREAMELEAGRLLVEIQTLAPKETSRLVR